MHTACDGPIYVFGGLERRVMGMHTVGKCGFLLTLGCMFFMLLVSFSMRCLGHGKRKLESLLEL